MKTAAITFVRTSGAWLHPLMLFALLVAAWQMIVSAGIWDPTIVPSPSKTAAAAWEFRALLAADALVTASELMFGFIITVCGALIAAVALHLLPRVLRGVYGFLVVLQLVPLWAIAPVLFYWTGPGLLTRLIVIVLVAFFPVLVNTIDGLRRVDRDLSELLTSLNATAMQKLFVLEIPSAFSMVLAGSKVTLTMCLIGAVLAEMLIGDMVGLGYRIKEANAYFRVDLVFASIAVLAAIGASFYLLLALIARQIEPWTTASED